MLRTIETGGTVHMIPMAHETLSVDTPHDLERVIEMMENDELRTRYAD